ncbi:hypothetical protein J9978_21210 [Chromobacterium violaceum]|uniref:hypothetical protein n=1 Tax=Chromobacterium violaceum TaxID=536 RepID=UPI001B33A42A|nr:hypothetical protein [Chromobacterium violaceum]MBP4051999.1 hypothetical protein [Chromobacterium violaceum]
MKGFMSRVEQLMNAAESALLGATSAGERVSRDLQKGLNFGEFPSLCLHQLHDVNVPGAPIGYEYRQLTIELEMLAEGDVPHSACEAFRAEVHTVLHGRLDVDGVQAGAVQWEYDEENPRLGICRAQYLLTYRRREGEL